MSKAHIPFDRLQENPHQSRLDVGDIEPLAITILDHGLQSVPSGRLVDEEGTLAKDDGMLITMAPTAELDKNPDWAVQLAAGHRRKEAVRILMDLYETEGALNGKVVTRQRLQRAGLRPGKMPVEVKALTDSDMLDVLTIENAQREALSPIEQARLIGELDAAGRSNQEIAERFGKSPSWVSNRKRLLGLPTHTQEAVHDGQISTRQAEAMLPMYELSEEEEKYLPEPNEFYDISRSGIEADAYSGISSERIRERVEAQQEHIETVMTAPEEPEEEDSETESQQQNLNTQTDDNQRDGEEAETGYDGGDVGGPGEVVSGHDEDLQGSQAGGGAEECPGAAGATAEMDLPVTDTGGEPGAIGQLIAEVEQEAMAWELGSSGDTYFARIQDGGDLHAMTGAETPVQAFRQALMRARGETHEVGHVDQADVSALLSCSDPEEMWDEQAARGASIASLYVAYCVSEERMEQWRSDLLVEEMRERADSLTEEDFPEDVWAEVQAEIDRQLEPASA